MTSSSRVWTHRLRQLVDPLQAAITIENDEADRCELDDHRELILAHGHTLRHLDECEWGQEGC